MEAILIDRNFEFRPQNMSTFVKGSIGVVCSTDAELHFLISYLQGLDLQAEMQKFHQQQAKLNPPEEKPKLRLKKDVDKESEDRENNGIGTISSLEID